MFNPNARIINCNTCGDITEQIIKNGKVIKNCAKCRELNNNKKKQNKNNEPPIKYEAPPPEGFYKGDPVLYLNNIKEQEAEQESTTSEEQPEEQPPQEETPEEPQEDNPQEEKPKEKTIKEILNDILNKIDKSQTADNNNNNKHEDTQPILNAIVNGINNNDNKLNDFIKEQQLKNKIIINKLDNILKAIT